MSQGLLSLVLYKDKHMLTASFVTLMRGMGGPGMKSATQWLGQGGFQETGHKEEDPRESS